MLFLCVHVCSHSTAVVCQQESREMAEERQKEKDELLREHKKTERELIKNGKKPFYMKKCEI